MKRIRHLESKDYIIPIGQKNRQVILLSNHCNIFLRRTWHKEINYSLNIHAKFNADDMNGIQVLVNLESNGNVSNSEITSAKLYRVDEADWSDTFVSDITLSNDGSGIFTGDLDQSDLGLNELSGMETYSIVVEASRKRKKFKSKVWFNHIGCFDNILRARNEIRYLNSTKLDE